MKRRKKKKNPLQPFFYMTKKIKAKGIIKLSPIFKPFDLYLFFKIYFCFIINKIIL